MRPNLITTMGEHCIPLEPRVYLSSGSRVVRSALEPGGGSHVRVPGPGRSPQIMHRPRSIRWAPPGFGGSKLLDIPADLEVEDRGASILRLLADPGRLRVVAALVLGYERPAEIASATGMGEGKVRGALARLAAGGLVHQMGDGGYRFAIDELKTAVRRAPSGEEELRDASAEQGR